MTSIKYVLQGLLVETIIAGMVLYAASYAGIKPLYVLAGVTIIYPLYRALILEEDSSQPKGRKKRVNSVISLSGYPYKQEIYITATVLLSYVCGLGVLFYLSQNATDRNVAIGIISIVTFCFLVLLIGSFESLIRKNLSNTASRSGAIFWDSLARLPFFALVFSFLGYSGVEKTIPFSLDYILYLTPVGVSLYLLLCWFSPPTGDGIVRTPVRKLILSANPLGLPRWRASGSHSVVSRGDTENDTATESSLDTGSESTTAHENAGGRSSEEEGSVDETPPSTEESAGSSANAEAEPSSSGTDPLSDCSSEQLQPVEHEQNGVTVVRAIVNGEDTPAVSFRISNDRSQPRNAGILQTFPDDDSVDNYRTESQNWSLRQTGNLVWKNEVSPESERQFHLIPQTEAATPAELHEQKLDVTVWKPSDEEDSERDISRGAPKTEDGSHRQQGHTHDELDTTYVEEPPDRSFDDVVGMEDVLGQFRTDIIKPFTNPLYDEYEVESVCGVLLHGPPGTGKTHLSKSLAGEIGFNFIEVGSGDLSTQYAGKAATEIKEIFAEARENDPCVVFFDEFETLAQDRDSDHQSNSQKQTIGEILNEISETAESDADVLVIATTNKLSLIDEAAKRTGRFDRNIKVEPPDADTREKLLEHYIPNKMNMTLDSDDIDFFRSTTEGLTGSDVEEIAKTASRRAVDHATETGATPTVSSQDLQHGVEVIDEKSAKDSGSEYLSAPPELDFSDVVGMTELKQRLHDKIIDPLENPERYEEYGLGVEHGFLLYGPPGTGKTYISKCLAGELDINYIKVDAADLTSKWVGEAAENTRQMFEEAREHQPTLVFIDEIDALTQDRNEGHQTNSERQMVQEFLSEIGEIHDENEDVIVIGATNHREDIDSAMLRTGRLGEKIEVPAPDDSTRVDLFREHLEAPHESIPEAWLAESTDGLVASDMEQLASEAARNAMKRSRTESDEVVVTQNDIERALDKIGS